MNRIELLALARKHGYTGSDDAALAWIKANINFESSKGKTFDLDAAWASKPTIKLADADTGTDDASNGQKSATATANAAGGTVTLTEAEAAQFRELKSQDRRHARDHSEFGGRLAGLVDGEKGLKFLNSPEGLRRYTARKEYERTISAGKSVFATVDQVEAFNANFRLVVSKQFNQDYKGRQFDTEVVKAWGNNVNELGGVLVPTEFESVLLYATEQYGLARQIANVVRMKGDIKYQPRLTGGVTMSHVGPSGAIGTTDAGTDSVKLTADKIGCILKFDQELMEDSAVNIGDVVALILSEAYNTRVDQDYFIGDGTAAYGNTKGVATALRSGAYIDAAGSTWDSITLANILKLFAKVENVNPANLMGVCSRQFAWDVLQRLETAASNFKELMSGSTPIGCTFRGYPIKYSQVMPIATASGSKVLAFGDFKGGSMIGERRDLRIEGSDQAYWANDQFGFKATARVAVHICSDGRSGTFGNLVVLKTT